MLRALIVLVALAGFAPQLPNAREALRLGRSQDEALYKAFSNGYSLSPADPVSSAEIITEFRRAVMIVREHAQQGEYGFTERDLDIAMKPHRGLITFIVEVNLHPLNTYVKVPAYEMYVSTGSGTPPVAAEKITRDAIYAFGIPAGPGSTVRGVRLEATMSRDKIAAAAAPELIVTNENADVVWRAHLDLSRFR
jgi:hypothetical protein